MEEEKNLALWRLYYHLICATKERQALIIAAVELKLWLHHRQNPCACSIVHAIGGTENHIHGIASIPPKLSISDFVKPSKGSSAHHLNSAGAAPFGWQRAHRIFSLGGKQLDEAIACVKSEKTHYCQGAEFPVLERDDQEDDGPAIWNHGEVINEIEIISP